MAENPYVNKVKYAGQTLMDLTGDTVTPSDVLNGTTFHDRSGAPQTGNLITHNVYDGLDSTSISDALSAKQGSVLNSKLITQSYSLLSGVITIKKISNVVFVNIKGAVTLDSNGIIATLPEAYRPNVDVYSFITSGGSDTNMYLIEIDDSTGNLKIYNRGATITYAYGHFCYVIN